MGQQKYFELIEVVGNQGRYQKISLIILSFTCFLSAAMSLGTPFFFFKSKYVCEHQKDQDKCNKIICALPRDQRWKHVPQDLQLLTLANRNKDYACDQSNDLSVLQSCYYIGELSGYFLLSMFADNKGRRPSIIICLVITTLGTLIILYTHGVVPLAIGRAMQGFGLESSFNFSMFIISETVENQKRQQFLTIANSVQAVGRIVIVVLFYFIHHWFPIMFITGLVPSVICLIAVIVYIEQTPQFLVKNHSTEQVMRNFHRIAAINGHQQEYYSSQIMNPSHIDHLKLNYEEQMNVGHKTLFNFMDLFIFRSLRLITIFASILFFVVDFLRLGPTYIIDKLGFNIFINGIVFGVIDMMVYALCYIIIGGVQRRCMGLFLFSICIVFTVFSLLVEVNDGTEFLKFFATFIFRFAAALQYQIFLIYLVELFPTQIGSIGFGFASLISTFSSISVPYITDFADDHNISMMYFFIFVSMVGMLCSFILPQTSGHPPKEQIDQLYIEFNEERYSQYPQEILEEEWDQEDFIKQK